MSYSAAQPAASAAAASHRGGRTGRERFTDATLLGRDRLVPDMYVGAIRVIVDKVEGADELPQCELVMERAGVLGGPDDQERGGGSRVHVATIEGGGVRGYRAATEVRHRVMVVPPIPSPEDEAEGGEGGSGVGELDQQLGAPAGRGVLGRRRLNERAERNRVDASGNEQNQADQARHLHSSCPLTCR